MTVAADGTLAAIQEPSRITVVEIPSCAPFAELGTDGAAAACEVAWVGAPPRLLVLARYETHSIVHLVDPFGPRTISEIRLESPMRLYAAVGSYALAIGAAGAAVLAASDKHLTPYQFPARAVPVTAGAAGAQFVVAMPGSIEEWDPQNRMPKRRLKLPRVATITAVGGSDRVVWMTTAQEPNRIDVIPFVNRGQPKAHELPEPIASVASHPRSDVIACVGATSGRVWVIDLDGRTGLRMVGPEGIDRAEAVGMVLGRVGGVLAAQAKHRVTVVTLDRNDALEAAAPREKSASIPPPVRSTLYGDDDAVVGEHAVVSGAPFGGHQGTGASPVVGHQTAGTSPFGGQQTSVSPTPFAAQQTPVSASPFAAPQSVPVRSSPFNAPPSDRPVRSDRRGAAPTPPTATPHSPQARPTHAQPLVTPAIATEDPFASFRDRVENPRARTQVPVPALWPDASPTWRDELAAWARAVSISSAVLEPPPSSPVDQLTMRFELGPQLESVIALVYAHHLLGLDGAAPVDIARMLGGAWPEALGRGELADRGVAIYRDSRVRLAAVVLRALDELPPQTGTLIGTPGIVSLLGPCVIVSTSPLPIIAEACVSSIGSAILAAHDDTDPVELVDEARAYGAAPLWRVRADQMLRVPADKPIILVADNDAHADLLGVARLT